MHLFALAFQESGESYIEFYWAEDADHALEQGTNAHPEVINSFESHILCAAMAPDDYVYLPVVA